MSTPQPPLSPGDAPFLAGTVPSGWDRIITVEEADAANLLYPVPPYGNTYFPPGNDPAAEPELAFIKLTNVLAGNPTVATLRPGDAEKLAGKDTFTVWPISGRAGVLDDLPARAVRITSLTGDEIRFNLDTDGLNVTDLVFLGVVYDSP